jgi:glycosyltransferase involved in cell wall biosynthesis
MERYIPAKLFEYMASGKPVLVHGVAGEASRIVTQLRAGVFGPAGDASALHAALNELRESIPDDWNTPERHRWAEQHTREALAQRFFGLLNTLVDRDQSDKSTDSASI